MIYLISFLVITAVLIMAMRMGLVSPPFTLTAIRIKKER